MGGGSSSRSRRCRCRRLVRCSGVPGQRPQRRSGAEAGAPSPWPGGVLQPGKNGCLPRTSAAGVPVQVGSTVPEPSLPAPTPHGSPEGPRSSRLSRRLCPAARAELGGAPQPRVGAERGEAAALTASCAGIRGGNSSIPRRHPRGTRAGPWPGPRLRCGGGGAGRRRDANENGAGKAAGRDRRCVGVRPESPARERARAGAAAARGGLGPEGEAGRSRPGGAAGRDSGRRDRRRLCRAVPPATGGGPRNP